MKELEAIGNYVEATIKNVKEFETERHYELHIDDVIEIFNTKYIITDIIVQKDSKKIIIKKL